MNISANYNLKMTYDQFGNFVDTHFFDKEEEKAIYIFEQVCLNLKNKKQSEYTMIELGSNQAYYSCLFRAIIDGVGNNKLCKNILLEPTEEYMHRGINHFNINGFSGIFERGGIGHYWCWHDRWHDKNIPSYSIDELMAKHNINQLDILHSDIDGNEIRLLETSTNAFKKRNINS